MNIGFPVQDIRHQNPLRRNQNRYITLSLSTHEQTRTMSKWLWKAIRS
jgi:hypothetical protein